jgi:hypothetical protein
MKTLEVKGAIRWQLTYTDTKSASGLLGKDHGGEMYLKFYQTRNWSGSGWSKVAVGLCLGLYLHRLV